MKQIILTITPRQQTNRDIELLQAKGERIKRELWGYADVKIESIETKDSEDDDIGNVRRDF